MKILIILLLGSGCLVTAMYFFHRHSFWRRLAYNREDILHAYGVDVEDYDFLVRVLSEVGKSYRIDYRKLRPTDSFDGNLKRLDSWVLDAGNEQLSKALLDFGLSASDHLHTVKDVVTICCQKK
jgi:hypothetical protein